jgi:alkaline phosphatase D
MGLTRRRFAFGALAALVAGCRSGSRARRADPPPSAAGDSSGLHEGRGSPAQPTTTSATATTSAGGQVARLETPPAADVSTDPFTLGVASGDPLPDRVALWTRLAPDLAAGDGGMPADTASVVWEVATDDAFTHLVATGTADAPAAHGHTVHVDAGPLRPDTWYRYRFRIGAWTSPPGRTRTAPEPTSTPAELVLAVASCQNWQAGYYGAYAHLVADRPDLVVWCGDYIYESAASAGGPRQHDGPEAATLEGYRRRYAQYRSDPALQAAHAACPWVVTWDDHEVSGDYAGDLPGPLARAGDSPTGAGFLARRAAAYQAWWEHMPTRLPPPTGPELTIYRSLQWGRLAGLVVLDGRQYRSPQPCGAAGLVTLCAEREEPAGSMLGGEQEAWLAGRLRQAAAEATTWTVLVNQTLMTPLTAPTGPGGAVQGNMDAWDGYPAARRRLLAAAVDAVVANLVALSGDLHASVVGDLQLDGRTIGTEFLGPGISSAFPSERAGLFGLASLVLDQVKLTEGRHRGYLRCLISAGEWRTDYRWVQTVDQPDTDLAPNAPAYVVQAGRPGARPA